MEIILWTSQLAMALMREDKQQHQRSPDDVMIRIAEKNKSGAVDSFFSFKATRGARRHVKGYNLTRGSRLQRKSRGITHSAALVEMTQMTVVSYKNAGGNSQRAF